MFSSNAARWLIGGLLVAGCAPAARRVGPPAQQAVRQTASDAGPAPEVAVTWTFPGLLATSLGPTFPTYLAHLFGKHAQHPLTHETVCAAVRNPRPTPLRARLQVGVPAFADPATQDLTVGAGATTTI